MIEKQETNLQKLQTLLKEMFQFDSSDLDFGIYKLMKQLKKPINDFIDNDLKKTIEKIGQNKLEKEIEEKEKELEEAKKDVINTLGDKALDNEGNLIKFQDTPKGEKYQKIKDEIDKLKNNKNNLVNESEIYEKILNFFNRYYSEGDFVITKKKKGGYLVEGNDVSFSWATKDQYYVKSGNFLSKYSFEFNLNENIKSIGFEIIQAEGDNNDKDDEKKKFVFGGTKEIKDEEGNIIETYDDFYIDEKNKRLVLLFERKTIDKKVYKEYEGETDNERFYNYIVDLIANNKDLKKIDGFKKELFKDEGKALKKNYKKWIAKMEKDFFIHKNLKPFLKKELDWYLKNEVYGDILDNSESVIKDKLEQLKVIKEVCEKIIDFLATIENFQKKLWEKKPLVKNTEYVVSLKTLRKYLNDKEFEKVLSIFKDTLENNKEFNTNHKFILSDLLRSSLQVKYVYDIKFDFKKNKINVFYKKFKKTEKKDIGEKILLDDYKLYKDKQGKFYYYNGKVFYEEIPKSIEPEILNLINHTFIDTKYISNIKNRNYIINIINKIGYDGLILQSDNFQALNFLQNKYKEKIDLVWIDPPFNTDNNQFLYKDSFINSTWCSMIDNTIPLVYKLISNKGSFYLHLDENSDYLGKILLKKYFNHQRTLFWNSGGVGFKKTENWIRSGDIINFFTKTDNFIFNKLRDNKDISSIISSLSIQDSWFNDKENLSFNGIKGTTQKPEDYLQKFIRISSNMDSIVLDYFAGTGTTLSTAHKLGRKWIGINVLPVFNKIFINRMKKVLIGDMGGISKEVKWQGGGAFKYIDLENYEDVLNNLSLKDNFSLEEINEIFEPENLESFRNDNISLISDEKFITNYISNGEQYDLVETFNNLIGLDVNNIEYLYDSNNKVGEIITGKDVNGNKVQVIWIEKDYIQQFKEEINEKIDKNAKIYCNNEGTIKQGIQYENILTKFRKILFA